VHLTFEWVHETGLEAYLLARDPVIHISLLTTEAKCRHLLVPYYCGRTQSTGHLEESEVKESERARGEFHFRSLSADNTGTTGLRC